MDPRYSLSGVWTMIELKCSRKESRWVDDTAPLYDMVTKYSEKEWFADEAKWQLLSGMTHGGDGNTFLKFFFL